MRFLAVLPLLAACSSEPAYVSRADLDRAVSRGDMDTLCAGLAMPEAKTRRAAAENLKRVQEPAACLCERVVRKGAWDADILAGLEGAEDAARFGCVGEVLADTTQKDRAALATALTKIPAARTALAKVAKEDADVTVRAAAIPALRGTSDSAEIALLTELLQKAPEEDVRAAAASALLANAVAGDALRAAAASDTAPKVRAAAYDALLAQSQAADHDTLACAGLADADAYVRTTVANLLKGSRSPEKLACMRARMLVEEPDDGARAALLAAVASSPRDEAAAILCDSIPAWGRMYLKAGFPKIRPATELDVAYAQNERDHENSYACFQKHAGAAGLSCEARRWILDWYKAVGGGVAVPRCGGGGGAGAASNEVSFD